MKEICKTGAKVLMGALGMVGMIASAATVNFQMERFTGTTNNRPITISLASDPVALTTNIVFGVPVVLQPTNSRATINLLPANYWVGLDQVSVKMFMPVPDSTNTYNAVDLIKDGLKHLIQQTNYIIADTNILNYYMRTNGDASGLTNFPAFLTTNDMRDIFLGGSITFTNGAHSDTNIWVISLEGSHLNFAAAGQTNIKFFPNGNLTTLKLLTQGDANVTSNLNVFGTISGDGSGLTNLVSQGTSGWTNDGIYLRPISLPTGGVLISNSAVQLTIKGGGRTNVWIFGVITDGGTASISPSFRALYSSNATTMLSWADPLGVRIFSDLAFTGVAYGDGSGLSNIIASGGALFDTTQFGATGVRTNIKSGATLTNLVLKANPANTNTINVAGSAISTVNGAYTFAGTETFNLTTWWYWTNSGGLQVTLDPGTQGGLYSIQTNGTFTAWQNRYYTASNLPSRMVARLGTNPTPYIYFDLPAVTINGALLGDGGALTNLHVATGEPFGSPVNYLIFTNDAAQAAIYLDDNDRFIFRGGTIQAGYGAVFAGDGQSLTNLNVTNLSIVITTNLTVLSNLYAYSISVTNITINSNLTVLNNATINGSLIASNAIISGTSIQNIINDSVWKTNAANGGITNANSANGGLVSIANASVAVEIDGLGLAPLNIYSNGTSVAAMESDGNWNRIRGVTWKWPNTNISNGQFLKIIQPGGLIVGGEGGSGGDSSFTNVVDANGVRAYRPIDPTRSLSHFAYSTNYYGFYLELGDTNSSDKFSAPFYGKSTGTNSLLTAPYQQGGAYGLYGEAAGDNGALSVGAGAGVGGVADSGFQWQFGLQGLAYPRYNAQTNFALFGSALSNFKTGLLIGAYLETYDSDLAGAVVPTFEQSASLILDNRNTTNAVLIIRSNGVNASIFDKTGKLVGSGAGLTNLNASNLASGTVPAAQMPALTGDVTSSAGSMATTMKNTGTAGTYRSVTFDAQGRETSGSNPTTFSGYGLSDTSANLAAALTDETGAASGTPLAVFNQSPTIVTPTIASFASANHNHQNSAGGGALDAAAITSGVLAIGRLATGTPDGTKFVRDDGTLVTPTATATNLGTLVFPTNAGSVAFIDLPVASAVAGTLEAYALQIAGTNAISIRAGADATSITNPVITMEIPTMWFTNSLASWPKVPVQAGATAMVFSNGLPYWLFSTNGAGGGSTTWTSTNRAGW